MNSDALHSPILDWFADHARPLPWRAADRTPWGVLVSEVMSQQTPVTRVEPVWRQWLARWPTASDLAQATTGDAVRAWGRLGYPRRALRLHAAATQIRDRHGSEVPSSYDDLLALPGVGDYTAAAVASFAFGARHAVLDTNVRRVLARAVLGQGQPGASVTVAERATAESLIPDGGRAAPWAAAVMELGALVCTARAPRCHECPVADRCAWRLAGYPAYGGPVRRRQGWHGTDRQVRGRLLDLVRSRHDAVPESALAAAVPDSDLGDPQQRDRCLSSLVDDGLLDQVDPGLFALPHEVDAQLSSRGAPGTRNPGPRAQEVSSEARRPSASGRPHRRA